MITKNQIKGKLKQLNVQGTKWEIEGQEFSVDSSDRYIINIMKKAEVLGKTVKVWIENKRLMGIIPGDIITPRNLV